MYETHVVKSTTANGYTINYYKGNRVYRYTDKDNLPETVTMILINGECYETKYTEYGKIERFR